MKSSIPRANALVLGALLLIGNASNGQANLKLAAIFGDNMVLQRDTAANIWGSATPGESVTVTLDGVKGGQATADSTGHWQLKLPPQKAGGAHEVVVTGANAVTLHNVLFGDVWVLSGQSNMDFPCDGVLKPDVLAAEKATANFPEIRLCTINKRPKGEPKEEWKLCTPETMARFSGTGYFFGREIHKSLGVPIGLINAAWSGQRSESFTSRAVLEKLPEFAALKARWDKIDAEYPAKQRVYEQEALPKWQAEADQAKQSGLPAPKQPSPIPGRPDDENRPGVIFQWLIEPLIPLSIKGFAWYQGESNADNRADAIAYRVMFPAMIQDWRARWGSDLPFLFVQLANFREAQTEPVSRRDAWPYARESQTLALRLPNTGMALAIDLNHEPKQIHPADKVTTGRRLGQVALGKVYGLKVPFTGPSYQGIKVEGNRVRVSFTGAETGLKARGETLKGFAIAGADEKFVWADATIDGADVVVSSPQVAAPVAVRYDWADNPIGNLYNGADLPAGSFRSDTTSFPGKAAAPFIGHVVTLRALSNGKYVSADPNGNGPLINHCDQPEQAEKFTVIDRGCDEVSLQSKSNGKYTWALPKGIEGLQNSSNTLGSFETFEIVPMNHGTVALFAVSNRQYVTADPDGIKPLINSSAKADRAETFQLTLVP